MEQPKSTTTLGLAYVNREKEREFNKAKYEAAASEWTCCSIDSLRDWVIERYNSKQKYIHCELAFSIPDDEHNCLAYGVFEDKGVVRQKRTFSNESYQWIFLNVTPVQYTAVSKFCNQQVGKKYDYSSTGWRLIACPIISDKITWWCASFVHAALQKAGLLKYYSVNTLDVDDIVELVSKQQKRIIQSSTPFMFQSATDVYSKNMFGEDIVKKYRIFGKDGKVVSCK